MLQKLLEQRKDVDVSRMRAKDFLARQQELEGEKRQRIESRSGWKDVPACPVCDCAGRTPELEKYGVTLVRCADCGVRYGDRIAADPADVYGPQDYVSFSLADTEDHFLYRRDRFGRERVDILERFCGPLRPKKILDVGCGNGYFLAAAKERCDHCFGTEFSERLRAFAIEKTGLPIFDRDLSELPERGFDIITLFDVIEHIPNPVTFMQSVSALLNPGGYVLVFTPNFDSFSIRIMGQYSSIVDPTEHVVLFTLPSLDRFGGRLNFETVYTETQGLDVQNVIALAHLQGKEPDAILIEREAELQAMINASACGDYARILYRKRAIG
jgi:SAM-dependent methyltransferase